MTPRLFLLTPSLEDYLAYRNAPEGQPHDPIAHEQASALLDRQPDLIAGGSGGWLALGLYAPHDASGPMLGEIGAFFDDRRPHQADIGWSLHPAHRGQGLATEAMRGLLDWLFGVRGLHRVTAGCLASNVASWRVMERLGMRRESETRCSRQVEGGWQDEVGYALLAEEWRANHEKTE